MRGVPLVMMSRITSSRPPAVSLLSSGPNMPAIRVGLVWQTPQDVSKNRQPSFCWSLSSTSAAAASWGMPAIKTIANQPHPFILLPPAQSCLSEAAGSLAVFRGVARRLAPMSAQNADRACEEGLARTLPVGNGVAPQYGDIKRGE